MVITGIVLAKPFAILFAAGDQKMIEITVLAMIIYSISFAFSGLCILFSCYFTALNNGIVSAIISMSRCLLFQAGLVFIIPLLFGEYGIFWSVPISELLALVLASFFILIKRKKYGY